MKNAMRSATPHYTWIQGCYWMVYCILLSFSSVYLLEQGLSNTEIGLLLGLSGLASALLQPVAGARAGRMRRLSLGQLSGCLVGGMGLCALGLLLLPGKWVQGGLFMVLLALLQMLAPFLYAIGMGCAAQNIPLNFGLARGVGAGAYALASSLCGGLTALWGVGSIPLVLLAASLLLLAGYRGQLGIQSKWFFYVFYPAHLLGLPAPRPAAPAPTTSGEDPAFLRKYPHLLPLLVGATLLYTSHNVIMRFPYQIIQGVGGGSVEMGQLLTVQGLMDIPAMVVFSLLLRRAGCRTWVRLASVSFFLHALLTWVAPSLPVLFAVQVFEMTGYGLYAVASVCFVRDLVAPEDQVQGQTFFNMTNTLGVVISCFAGGVLLDWAGPQAALAFATLTGAGGMGLVWVLLGRKVPVAVAQHG